MIRLCAVAPEVCNLNGDQGNLLALRNYLVAAGFRVQVTDVPLGGLIPECHLVLLGHASEAGQAVVESWLNQLLANVSEVRHWFGVGSGAIYLATRYKQKPQITERFSDFEVVTFEDLEVLGYRNTDTDLSPIQRLGEGILTMLHGPVLAKNPALLDKVAREVVIRAGLDWPATTPQALVILQGRLNRVCDSIWQLEAGKPLP